MITTGVLGGRWRASVSPWGAIEPWGSGRGALPPVLDWHIAADDRWHSPAGEAAVRQSRVSGTAVVETRVRIPDGDAVQRVYSVPDHGGLTVVEIENASPLPIAVAFTHSQLLSPRPPSAPIEGIDLPAGSVAFPVGHHATLTVALPHDGRVGRPLPGTLPPAAGVVRGWLATVERAGRLLLPDERLVERLVAERCELALAGPEHPDDDPVGFVLGVDQLVRMGERPDAWLPDLAHALEVAARSGPFDWALAAALDAADAVFAVAGDSRARSDVALLRAQVSCRTDLPGAVPGEEARLVAWLERLLARPSADGVALLPQGLPAGWEGSNFEVYGLPVAGRSVSFAVRWHGARPAVLWDCSGEPGELSSPVLAPAWRSPEATGEALWPEPPGLPPAPLAPDDGGSFT